MIALLHPRLTDGKTGLVSDRFLTLLPQIRRQAAMAFRHQRPEAREELVQEVIARAYRTWFRLVQQGKEAIAYPTPLAQFAIRQVCAGRKVGSRPHLNDAMSRHGQRLRGFTMESLNQQGQPSETWSQMLVEDRQAGPAETAAARIDVAAWFRTLTKKHRQIAKALALGEPTSSVARRFDISPSRVSQLRAWFKRHWDEFQAETKSVPCAA